MTRLVALMTCHNRREQTLAAIEAYFAGDLPGAARHLVLVDDGSSDGTATAVRERFPDVHLEAGDGDLYWNRGMLRAWQRALALAPDHVLWLNDDTRLHGDALQVLMATERWARTQPGAPAIIVGTTCDEHGRATYGGAAVPDARWPLRMQRVVPGDVPQPAHTMNGNCVLVPREVWARIGLLDGVFRHSMGDNDYGFRARRAGIAVWVAPGFAGRCSLGARVRGSYADTTLPFMTRWRHLVSPKGLPTASWYTLCRRHGGVRWPLVWASPYLRLMATSAWRSVTQVAGVKGSPA